MATPHIERVQAKEDIIFEKLDRWIWSLRHDKPPTMEDVQPQLAMDALARIYGAGKKGLPTIEFPMKYEPQLRKIAALQEENAQLKGAIKKNEEAIEAHQRADRGTDERARAWDPDHDHRQIAGGFCGRVHPGASVLIT